MLCETSGIQLSDSNRKNFIYASHKTLYHMLKPSETFGMPISEPDCLSLITYVELCGTHSFKETK
jgi:hypothetical protein